MNAVVALKKANIYTDLAQLGLTSITVNGLDIILTRTDGSQAVVNVPIPDATSIVDVDVDENNYLICILSDGTTTKSTNPLVIEGGGSGEDNAINSISVNGTNITPDENKNVDITIPSTDGLATTEYVDNAVQNVQVDLTGYATEDFVTDTLVDYVAKEDGKGLSTNDLTDDLKTTYDKAVTDSHTHDNKDVIDGITEEKVATWDKAEENVQSDWEQTDDTSDDFIKNKPEFEVLSEDDIIALLGLSTEELEGLASILSDTEVRIDKTYSSSKIYNELNRVLEEGKTYTLEEIAKSSGASYKIANSTTEMVSTKYIYLLANGDTYDMYICEEENSTPVKIGTTSVTLTDYYTKTECDERYVLAIAFELLNNSIGDVNNLQTSSKVVVDSVNEVLTSLGDITTLKTTAQDNVVNAVNEVKKSIDEFETYVELTQEEYDALADDETGKLNGTEYRTTDTGKIYKNGVQYGGQEPEVIEGFAKYKEMKEAGLIDPDAEYLITSDENGILLDGSDVGYNNAESGIEATTIQGAIDKVAEIAESPIKPTLDIALAENDCDNIPSLMEDLTTVVCTVSGDIVAHTPKDTFPAESGFFEITTTRQNGTYAWQTAKKLAEKSNTFQRCLLNGVWSDWTSIGSIRNEVTNDVNTWSSSKIAQQINNATAIKYDNVINASATKETDWSLAQGESHFYGRLLQLDGHLGSKSSTFSFLLFVKANYDNPTTVYVTQLAGMDDDRTNIAHTTYFELGVSSSGNLTITNKSAVAASYRFI